MRKYLLCAAIAVSLAAATCEDLGPNISGVNAIGISKVRVSPAVDTAFRGDTATSRIVLTATAYTRLGDAITGLTYVWSSSNNSIATVDQTGVVTPVNPGSVIISASAGKIGHATVVVFPGS